MATIARTSAANIATGKKIYASDINAELNQLVNESNSKETRVTDLETDLATVLSGSWTKTGTATFSGAFNVDGAADFDGTVNIDGALTATSTAAFSGATSVTGTLTTTGVKRAITEIDNTDSPYTVVAGDHYINCNATSGAITVTLPAASAGRVLVITKTDSSTNAVTISGTVSGETNPILYAQNESIALFASSSAWYADGGLPKRQRIEVLTAAPSATLSTTNAFTSNFDRYEVVIEKLAPQTDNVELLIEVSTDGGSTWKSTTYSNSLLAKSASGSDVDGFGTSNAAVRLNNSSLAGIGNAAGEDYTGVVEILDPSNSNGYIPFHHRGTYKGTSGTLVYATGSGYYGASGAVTHIRFKFSSGNIQTGTLTIIGVRN